MAACMQRLKGLTSMNVVKFLSYSRAGSRRLHAWIGQMHKLHVSTVCKHNKYTKRKIQSEQQQINTPGRSIAQKPCMPQK